MFYNVYLHLYNSIDRNQDCCTITKLGPRKGSATNKYYFLLNNVPHVKRSHQSDHILTIFWEFKFGDFSWIEIRWVVFL